MLSRLGATIAFGIAGIAFVALIVFELSSGIAAAKFGAAALHSHPGTFSFFIALQAFFAIVMFAAATGVYFKSSAPLRRIVIGPLLIVLVLFVWTIVETVRDMLALGAGLPLVDRLVSGGIGLVLLVVLCTLAYQMIWLEIRDRLR